MQFGLAFVIPAGQLLLTRRGKTRMYTVGIVFELYGGPNSIQCPFKLRPLARSLP